MTSRLTEGIVFRMWPYPANCPHGTVREELGGASDIARQQLHQSPRMTPRIQPLSARPGAATSTVNRQQPGCRTDGAHEGRYRTAPLRAGDPLLGERLSGEHQPGTVSASTSTPSSD
jgi:hypothetical protein